MAVKARQHFKRMRGGANAQLMLADDDHSYVVKFRNNPQHQRILVNELIAGVVLDYLGLPSCAWEIVDVSEALIRASPDLYFEVGKQRRAPEAGLQFGSRYPVDPFRQAVYDYVPISLLRMLANLKAFVGMLVFDKWISNANGRQAVFYRAPAKDWAPPTFSRKRKARVRRWSTWSTSSTTASPVTRSTGIFPILRRSGYIRGARYTSRCRGSTTSSRG